MNKHYNQQKDFKTIVIIILKTTRDQVHIRMDKDIINKMINVTDVYISCYNKCKCYNFTSK